MIFISALSVSVKMPAADLPSLPAASQIRTGALDNGIAYYIVTNNSEKGKANVALVQKSGYDYETPYTAGSSAVYAMGALSSLPHFKSNSPFGFLSRNCIWPGADGYVSVYPDATIYRFENLELTRSKELVDSTLLMVFDIIGTQSDCVGGRYSPGNQAIVISGDVDASAVINKMTMLSLLVTRGSHSEQPKEYVWKGTDEAEYKNIPSKTKGLSSVSAEYAYPRTPAKNMNTVQPFVSQKFAMELGIILKKRIVKALRKANIPYSDIKYSYVSSKDGSGDEKFRIEIVTSDNSVTDAAGVLSATLAAIDAYGAAPEEYRDAQTELVMNLRRNYTGDKVSNAGYVDQCISSYLYGSSLASASTTMDFFLTKNIQDDLGARLFNNFVSALLDRAKDLTIETQSDSLLGLQIKNKFVDSWVAEQPEPYKVNYGDTLKLKKSQAKIKLKSMTSEPLSGGQVWIFDNGLKVIFKNTPKTGMFHYMWLLKGGYSLVPGLKPGEGAYVSDMMKLYNLPGMSCYSFADMLSANGISMKGEVTMSDLRVSGAAPSSKLTLLLRALNSLTVNGSVNKEAFNYYRECQYAKMLETPSMASVVDSLLYPSNAWSPYKRNIKISDDFQKRTDKFFRAEFSKMNDGALIIVGDFDEFDLKKVLCRELGGFSTDKATSFRSRIQYKTGTGYASKVTIGDKEEVEIGVSVPLTYTSSNYMVSYIVAMALQDKLSKTLAKFGWTGRADWDFKMLPEERFNFRMYGAITDRIGVPASLVQVDSVEQVLSGMRNAIASARVSANEVSVYKNILLKSVEARSSDPEMIMSMLALRYSYGKDLVTRYKDNISAVTVDAVNSLLERMSQERTAGYAVRTRLEGEHIFEHPVVAKVEVEIPSLKAAEDSLGIASEGYRAIGIDRTSHKPEWLDSAKFRSFMPMLPKPLPFVEKKSVPESQPDSLNRAPAADSVVVNQIDSLASGQLIESADTLKTGHLKENVDTLKSALLKTDVTGAADSLSIKADSTARQNNHN